MPDNDKAITNRWLHQIPELDRGRRFPSLAPDQSRKLFDELLAAGDDEITGIIDTLGEVDDGKDWKARFVLGALASYVGAPDRKADQKKLEQVYAKALQADRPAGVKTFVAMQLQWFGTASSVQVLADQLSSKDRQLVDASAASLCAIGKPAIAGLKAAREKVDEDARAVIDHALAQIL